MDPSPGQLEQLLDLDARHDDLLKRLDELDRRVRTVLSEYQVSEPPPEPVAGLTAAGPDAQTC